MFGLRQAGSLDFEVRNGNLYNFVGGALQASGGYVIDSPAGRIDLTDLRLVPRGGDAPILDLVGSDGKAWLYVDRLRYELIDGKQRLALRTMDVRITPELAQRLGQPEVSGWTIAEMEMNWGTLFRFSFIVNQAPVKSTDTLRIAAAGDPKLLTAGGLISPGAGRHN